MTVKNTETRSNLHCILYISFHFPFPRRAVLTVKTKIIQVTKQKVLPLLLRCSIVNNLCFIGEGVDCFTREGVPDFDLENWH